MTKTIENTRPNDIHVEFEGEALVFPAATQVNGMDGGHTVNGVAEVTDAFFKKMQGHAVVGFYLERGWLLDATPEKPKPAKTEKEKTGTGKKDDGPPKGPDGGGGS